MAPDIHLYTASTMNGWKPLIFMEEVGVPYTLTHSVAEDHHGRRFLHLQLNGMRADVDRRVVDLQIAARQVVKKPIVRHVSPSIGCNVRRFPAAAPSSSVNGCQVNQNNWLK